MLGGGGREASPHRDQVCHMHWGVVGFGREKRVVNELRVGAFLEFSS